MTHALLESVEVSRAKSVRLGDDRDQVDSCAQSLHDFNVKWLERMASRTDEV